jgi:hypothetical protein
MGAKMIIIQGESGSGKTTSLRNLPVNESIILRPNTKDPVWPGWKKQGWDKRLVAVVRPRDIGEKLLFISASRPNIKYVILEDFTHAQAAVTRSEAFMEAGRGKNPFQRWEEFGIEVHNSIFGILPKLRGDMVIIMINHVDNDQAGRKSFRTFGRVIGNTTVPVSHVEIVLHSIILAEKPLKERYVFLTHDDGVREAKTPMGMFEDDYIPNDIMAVIERMKEHAEEN